MGLLAANLAGIQERSRARHFPVNLASLKVLGSFHFNINNPIVGDTFQQRQHHEVALLRHSTDEELQIARALSSWR